MFDDLLLLILLKKKFLEKFSLLSVKKLLGIFFGVILKVSGKIYSGKMFKVYVGGCYVLVNYYYNVGFLLLGWFGYYSGFIMGMFMISMMYFWGYIYYLVGGSGYVFYGVLFIVWIVDVIVLIIILFIVIVLICVFKILKMYRRSF